MYSLTFSVNYDMPGKLYELLVACLLDEKIFLSTLNLIIIRLSLTGIVFRIVFPRADRHTLARTHLVTNGNTPPTFSPKDLIYRG